MRDLKLSEIENVSGGDFDFTISLSVPTSVSAQFTGLFQQLITGQLVDTNAFIASINQAITNGANFNHVVVQSIEYSSINNVSSRR